MISKKTAHNGSRWIGSDLFLRARVWIAVATDWAVAHRQQHGVRVI